MADITIVNGGYKPTYNWGAPPWMWPIFNHRHRQGSRIYWTAAPKKRCGLDELMSCGNLECLTGLTFRQPGPGMTWHDMAKCIRIMPSCLCHATTAVWLIYAIVWGGSITGPLLALTGHHWSISGPLQKQMTRPHYIPYPLASRGSIGSSVLHQLGWSTKSLWVCPKRSRNKVAREIQIKRICLVLFLL